MLLRVRPGSRWTTLLAALGELDGNETFHESTNSENTTIRIDEETIFTNREPIPLIT